MGIPRAACDPDDLTPAGGTPRVVSRERLGPMLSALGLVGWLMIGLTLRLIWSGYDESTDVLLMQGITSSLASVLVVIGGGAASLTLSAIGGLICGTRLIVHRLVDRWTIIGLIASLVGFTPVALFVVKLFTA
ncbi:hypothetical protein AB1L88_06995 [Tautonia sp. JC769]|uniref:hypothetical protein n=1 Tax=Tautonia sp. JC769 TaxID=3232135 RepID=UPI003458381C